MSSPMPPPRPAAGASSPGERWARLVAELRRTRRGYGPAEAAEDAAALLPWRSARDWRPLVSDALGDPAGLDALRRILAFLLLTGRRPSEGPEEGPGLP